MNRVNVCGHIYDIVECEDVFDVDSTHFGKIDYKQGIIYVNKDLTSPLKKEVIIHEMVHGILFHIGQDEKSQDEEFVQAMANAIYQGFQICEYGYEGDRKWG